MRLPDPPSDPDSDVTSMASFGGSDGNSKYVESTKKSPTSSSNTPYIAIDIRKLEIMHKVSLLDISDIFQPTMLFTHTNDLEIQELAHTNNNLAKNLQDNGATPQVGTHPSSPHSPLEDTLVATADPPTHSHVEARDTALQERAGDLPDVRFLGAKYMLFGVYQYQDWVHQNTGDNLDG